MEEKIYIASGKKKTFQNGGSIISVHLPLDDLKKYFEEYGYTSKAGKHILKLNIATRKQVGQYGDTHSVSIDTWKPEHGTQEGDIPF